jgi:hypothetical protein
MTDSITVTHQLFTGANFLIITCASLLNFSSQLASALLLF